MPHPAPPPLPRGARPAPPAPGGMLDRLIDTRRPRLWLTLLCALLWLPGFFTLPPGDRDESRFAQATRQMLETGDAVRIRYGDEERNKKPAGIHWAQAASVLAAEATGLADRAAVWPYRVPGLLGALLAVLATHHAGRALVGRRPAFLGAALLAASLVLVAEVHIAKTDAALLGAVCAAMGLMGRAYLAPLAFGPGAAAAFWLALAAGVLLKGPIAPLVVGLAALTLVVADRSWRGPRATLPGSPGVTAGSWGRALRPGWGVPLLALAASPWFVAIGIATEGRFFAQAVGGDMLAKVGAGEESHWGPPGTYLLSLGLAAFPGAALALAAAAGTWGRRAQAPTRFLLAWAVPTWLLFEAFATKLPHYVLPAYPPLFLLAAAWALDPLRRSAPRWLAWTGLLAVAAAAAALGLAPLLASQYLEARVVPAAWLGPPLALLLAWRVLRHLARGAPARAGMAGVLLAAPLYAVLLEGTLPRLPALWVAPRLAALVAREAGPLPPGAIGVAGFHEPSALFALGSATRLLAGGDAAAGFLAAAPGRVAAVGDRDEAAFRAGAAARGLAVEELGLVSGLNYSRGRPLTLTVFRTPP